MQTVDLKRQDLQFWKDYNLQILPDSEGTFPCRQIIGEWRPLLPFPSLSQGIFLLENATYWGMASVNDRMYHFFYCDRWVRKVEQVEETGKIKVIILGATKRVTEWYVVDEDAVVVVLEGSEEETQVEKSWLDGYERRF